MLYFYVNQNSSYSANKIYPQGCGIVRYGSKRTIKRFLHGVPSLVAQMSCEFYYPDEKEILKSEFYIRWPRREGGIK